MLENPKCPCKKGVVGGTFSLLHKGHRHLLEYAFRNSEKLVVGVTSDEFVRSFKKSHPVEPYELRALVVLIFLYSLGNKEIEIVPIDDIYGPTLSDPDIDCIFVSEETLYGAFLVNIARKARGLRPLKIFAVDLLGLGKEKISSTMLWKRLLSYTEALSHL